MTNEIAIRGIDDAARVSKALADSGFYKDVKTASQAMVKVMAGVELGITPLAAMTGIHIVDGKVTLGSGLVASQIMRSGSYRYRIIESTAKTCKLLFQEKEGDKWIDLNPVVEFSYEDAKKAGLTGKQNWSKYPDAMLFARAITKGARLHTPQIFGGPIYTPEELGDPDPSKTIDVPSEVIEPETKGNGSETKAQAPEAKGKKEKTKENPEEKPAPKKEIMTVEQSKEIQKIAQSLTMTDAERARLLDKAAGWSREEATVKIAEINKSIAKRQKNGVSDGQKEYVQKFFDANKTLWSDIEIVTSIESIQAAENYAAAMEIIKSLKIEEAKRLAAKPEETIQDAQIVTE